MGVIFFTCQSTLRCELGTGPSMPKWHHTWHGETHMSARVFGGLIVQTSKLQRRLSSEWKGLDGSKHTFGGSSTIRGFGLRKLLTQSFSNRKIEENKIDITYY